ncbi:MAG: putative glutathione S-transferase [Oleiphilaceae bacterium]|jgi:putative glutathione S-transferase
MGLLQKGKWLDQWYDTKKSDGEFRRQDSRFRDWINNEPGANFLPESGRYHLYVSLACPWAHRTLIFRTLKGLEEHIGVTVVEPIMLENGWELQGDQYGLDFLYQLYLKADAAYEGRVTVPILWDKKTQTIVSNESAEIIRMFNSAFNELTGNQDDYYPEAYRDEIEQVNDRIYNTVNNGVYRAGFATTQEVYEAAFHELFDSLAWLEGILSKQRYLVGDVLTEADWRLFTTLIRFDAVYVGHFKCNQKRIADYPALSAYLRDLFQVSGIQETVNFEHIKTHYYASHKTINPTGIIPFGPEQDFMLDHDRHKLT